MRTIFALIAFLLGGGDAAIAQGAPPPAKPQEIVAYHDSGDWDADIDRVIGRARRQIVRHRDDHRPALVLDIDDTSLSTYECLKAVDFDRRAGRCGVRDDLPAIPQTRELYGFARRQHVRVFFITGRRQSARASTRRNLRAAGYRGKLRLRLRPNRERPGTHDGWKARTRARIEDHGHTIVANVGDQRSDLDGGHALRGFKLPNPMYVIPTA
ncbi:MAG TPA: HAD family acid phosphatase [Solirubrobacteraceae bacterium]|nr:HAD family acid phosphatase [Solirubrobacteraceae bacterium]